VKALSGSSPGSVLTVNLAFEVDVDGDVGRAVGSGTIGVCL